MSNGPISLPHINLHRQQQEQDPPLFQPLPPMQQQSAPTQNNHYYHGQSFTREGNAPSPSTLPIPLPTVLCSFVLQEKGTVLHGVLFLVDQLLTCVRLCRRRTTDERNNAETTSDKRRTYSHVHRHASSFLKPNYSPSH
jgi:hypothetical protein